MTGASVRHPRLQVTLLKNVGRQALARGTPLSVRFAGQSARVDLTPYIGEQGSVRTSKTLHEPAGTFSLTLTDMINPEGQDSLYGLIEPMDVIEIRMIGDGYKVAKDYGGVVPLMMRGFVSEVRRQEGMGGDGKPQRSVTVSGQDSGKIWQIMQIFMMPNAPKDSASLISSFPFFAQFGMAITTMPAEEFLQKVVDLVINPYLGKMRKQQGAGVADPIIDFKTDIQINDGNVMPFGLGGWTGGTIYSLLTQYLDVGAWNELFVDDRNDGPYIVYRPNPFYSTDRQKFLLPGKAGFAVAQVELDRSDVVSMTSVRSDANVSNYFWVDAPRVALNSPENLRLSTYAGDLNSFYLTEYGNVNPNLYGTRKMTEQTQQGGRSEKNTGNGDSGQDKTTSDASAIAWIKKRRLQLIDQNIDNVVLEHGSMRLKGNEKLRAGKYILLTHGNMKSLYYIVGVQHDYVPFGSYTTTVQFERGTGFIDRVQQNAPYYAELAQG